MAIGMTMETEMEMEMEMASEVLVDVVPPRQTFVFHSAYKPHPQWRMLP